MSLTPPCFAARIRRRSGPPSSPASAAPAPPSQTRRWRRRARSGAVTTSLTVPSTGRPVTAASRCWVGKVVCSWPATKAAATPAPTARISTSGQEDRPVRRGRNARHARRLDDLDVQGAGPAGDVAAQPHLLAIGEQLVILLLQHVIVAAEPALLGGQAGLGRLARGELGEVGLELVAARGGGGELRLALGHHRAQRDVSGVLDAATAAAARAPARRTGAAARSAGGW